MNYIFHHTDADGYASAAITKLYLLATKINANNKKDVWNNNDIKCIPYCYEPINTFVPYENTDMFKKDDKIFIVDLSVSTGTLEKFVLFTEMLYKKGCHLTWIDHHRSSVDDAFEVVINKRFEAYKFERYIDLNYCAAYNCYVYLLQNKLGFKNTPEILRIIDDWDCWKLKIDGTKEFINGFALDNAQLPDNYKWYDWLTDRGESLSIIGDCIHKGKIVRSWQTIDDTNKYDFSAFETTLCGLSCIAVNNRRNSDIFRTNKDYDVLLSYIYNGETYKYSIYSKNDNVYCNIISQLFGGGGHKGAAGFSNKKLVVSKKQGLFYKIKDKCRQRKYKKLKQKE